MKNNRDRGQELDENAMRNLRQAAGQEHGQSKFDEPPDRNNHLIPAMSEESSEIIGREKRDRLAAWHLGDFE